jgi:hypothetical protein
VPGKWCNTGAAGMSRVLQICKHSEDLGASGWGSVDWYWRLYRCRRSLLESECSVEISEHSGNGAKPEVIQAKTSISVIVR